MSALTERPWLIRGMLLAVTVVFVAVVIVVGQDDVEAAPQAVSGEPSPSTYVATADVTVENKEATATAQEFARNNVQTIYRSDPQAEQEIVQDITGFFDTARVGARAVPVPPFIGETTSPTIPETSVVDDAAGEDEAAAGDEAATDETTEEGEEAAVEETTTTSSTTTTAPTTTTTVVRRSNRSDQVDALAETYPFYRPATIEIMVKILNDDFDRDLVGGPQYFNDVEREAILLANQTLERESGILAGELQRVQADLLNSPPFVILPGLDPDDRSAVQVAIADIVANSLQATTFRDDIATELAREAAAEGVDPIMQTYVLDQVIVSAGEIVEQVNVDAINELGLSIPAEEARLEAMAAVAVLAVLLAAFFMGRVAPDKWDRPKLVALFGLLIVLEALSVRLLELLPADRPELVFLIPAPLFGFLAAILFDARTAALLAVPMATFTAISTGDLMITVFAAGAMLVPVPLVSSVSSRTQLRLAVLYTAAILAPYAFAVAWFFDGIDLAWRAAIAGFINGIISGVAALGLLPFLENLFRVTTTLTLLDLTDRNHPALRKIEEEAPGTFNHSILVATLAGKAARSIDANPLLAQAAAYYHDLGKTAQPKFFIENQFGVSNPHDEMQPEDSAVIIRSHVTEGLKLARKFRIPPEVAEGIRMHHGTGLMRYFYHKALDENPGVDPALFRHHGQKPRDKEMAILMLSDAVEGATRALVQHEDPTSEGLRKVVEQVVAEKVEDGQLDESSLTFGELTKVKDALVEALTAYYHTRIPYPGFPGTTVETMSA